MAFTNKLNYNPDGTLVSDEVIVLSNNEKKYKLLHNNQMQSKGISVYTGVNSTGNKITAYTIANDIDKPWVQEITFGTSVPNGTYYVTYYSEGDENDADDMNVMQASISQIMESPLFSSNDVLPIKIEEAGIIVPTDIRGVEKTTLYSYDSKSEPVNKIIETVAFDFINLKTFSGLISSSSGVSYYIQESTNMSEWFTTSKVTTTASINETIGVANYYTATPINYTPSLRYVRLIVSVGSTALTKLSIHLFSSSI